MSSTIHDSRVTLHEDLHCVGKSIPRVDAESKITGQAIFLDDLEFPNTLYGKTVISSQPHAQILNIDTKPALKAKGVVNVLTAKDIPGENQVGVVLSDQPLMAFKKVRYIGDCIALIAAETKESAQEASRLINIKYKKLKAVFSSLDGIKKSAPKIHANGNVVTHLKLRKGNSEAGFKKSDVIIEKTFTTQHQEHAYLETQGAIAVPQPDGGMIIYGSMQCPYYVQKAVAGCLGVGFNKVRVIQTTTGGAFGGKEDIPSEICSKAAVLAQAAKRPVKMTYDREEDMLTTSKRHPMVMKYKMGATKEGKLQASQIEIYADCGAYATLSTIVLYRSHIHAAGSYDIPNVYVDTIGVYTNHPTCGAFRGFGQPQVAFASERMMDILAEKLNLDPLDFRLKNALKPGSLTATSHKLSESVSMIETIQKAREMSEWDKKRREYKKENKSGFIKKGIGAASIFYGVSLGSKGWFLDRAGAHLQIWIDGTVNVAIGLTEMGQGALTVISQIAAETLGISIDYIKIGSVDTSLVPDSGPTVASRTTLSAGKAVYNAALQLKERLLKVTADILGVAEDKIKIKIKENKFIYNNKKIDYKEVVKTAINRNINLSAVGWYEAPPLHWEEDISQGEAYFIYSYATHIAEVQVNTKTGQIKVIKITAAHDLGKAINPQTVSGQIEGGVAQGLGYALYENLIIDKEGSLKTPNLATYTIPTALDVSEVESCLIEKSYSRGPYGAKGIGEPCLIPTAAAIANAVSNAIGRPINKLPILPEDII